MPPEEEHRIVVHLDELLADRGLTLTDLADRVGITLANLSILKNGRARAIRFSTLTALCDALDCQPGDLVTVRRVTRTAAKRQRSRRPRLDSATT
jgi:putative transcriptional regulator